MLAPEITRPKAIVSSAKTEGMTFNKYPYANRYRYNPSQRRANDIRRSAQHRTIEAVSFFKDS